MLASVPASDFSLWDKPRKSFDVGFGVEWWDPLFTCTLEVLGISCSRKLSTSWCGRNWVFSVRIATAFGLNNPSHESCIYAIQRSIFVDILVTWALWGGDCKLLWGGWAIKPSSWMSHTVTVDVCSCLNWHCIMYFFHYRLRLFCLFLWFWGYFRVDSPNP